MDPAAMALAGTLGTAVVSAMATDAWQSTRARIVAVLRRSQPEAAESVGRSLDEHRAFLIQLPAGTRQGTEDEYRRRWQNYFLELIQADPVAGRTLIEVVTPAPQQGSKEINQVGNAHDHSHIYIAANDQHFGRP
ncbi:hypothetical protein [Streptomyces sp. GbtcB6]|uniref:hypothetical protein n=1 Tax=Streptomyces sp. GbtcB6 TaxID=2824751 RepID=UPI001C2FB391|nr:hypothetical protein [Streptomyces sp. GbtcB6]